MILDKFRIDSKIAVVTGGTIGKAIALEGKMSKKVNPVSIKLPVYGLPRDTDPETFSPFAWDIAKTCEMMGVFDQRDCEPAHVFTLLKRREDE